jgi:hypothetical protein
MPVLAIVGLALTLIPSILVFTGYITQDINKMLMTIGTVVWFACAPIWFRQARKAD